MDKIILYPDEDLQNADWTKQTWDLPEYGSDEFNEFLVHNGITLEQFKKLPVYLHAVKSGLINEEDESIKILYGLSATFKDWDPNQPRDPDGRWAAGGGGGGGGGANSTGAPIPVIPINQIINANPNLPGFEHEKKPPASHPDPPTIARYRSQSAFAQGALETKKEKPSRSINKVYDLKIKDDGKGFGKFEKEEKIQMNESHERFYSAVKNFNGTDLQKCSMVQREVLASEVDKILGTNLVPDTVFEYSLKDDSKFGVGSRQAYADGWEQVSELWDRDVNIKSRMEGAADGMHKAMAFDALIGGCDRHLKNIGFSSKDPKQVWLIDNGYSFAKSLRAWNGDVAGCAMVRIAANHQAHTIDWVAVENYAKDLCKKAVDNEPTINKLFKEHKLPMAERGAFWDRAAKPDELFQGIKTAFTCGGRR